MAANPALDILFDIRDATFANAEPLPLKEAVQAQWQGLGFQIGGVRLVSKLGEVNELLIPPRLAMLPAVRSWVLGIANIRGRLIPIIDLHEFLNMPPTLPSTQWRVMVVEQGDVTAGLLVEQSLGMQHFLEENFEEADATGLESLRPYLRGAFRHGGRVFYEVELKAILRDDRFYDVAAHGLQ